VRHFIDRRSNPKGKSLGNRQRFVRRARAAIKEEVDKAIRSRKLADVGEGGSIAIPAGGVDEPRFRHAGTGGRHRHVLTGNSTYVVGDRIPKPESGAGAGGQGGEPSDQGEGEDSFVFALNRDEFLDLIFEDLELPDLAKTSLREVNAMRSVRSGYRTTGNPTNISVRQTMRHSYGRRLALRRPSEAEIESLRRELEEIEQGGAPAKKLYMIERLRTELAALERKRKWIPYIDPLDVRYSNFQLQPEPRANAVMFCLMDVSGSMGEREKDLAKRFFVLLHLFLQRRYDRVDLVFIRHTDRAEEVDEQRFFFGQETGGTVISSALTKMQEIIAARYPVSDWNIYAAQASDGDDIPYDPPKCCELLTQAIMPKCQYFAYVEILDEREAGIFNDPANGAALWRAYRGIAEKWPNFAMKRIARRGDIYPVFRELFAPHAATS
jgi:uncharacterized protein